MHTSTKYLFTVGCKKCTKLNATSLFSVPLRSKSSYSLAIKITGVLSSLQESVAVLFKRSQEVKYTSNKVTFQLSASYPTKCPRPCLANQSYPRQTTNSKQDSDPTTATSEAKAILCQLSRAWQIMLIFLTLCYASNAHLLNIYASRIYYYAQYYAHSDS